MIYYVHSGGEATDPRFNLTGRENVCTPSHIQDLITANGEGRSLVSVWPGARAGPAQETIRGELGTAHRRDREITLALFVSGKFDRTVDQD